MEYQKAQSEYERLSRLVVAHEYVLLQQRSNKSNDQIAAKHEAIKEGKRQIKRLQEESKRIEKDYLEISQKRDKELEKGGKIQTLQEKIKDYLKDLAKYKTQLDLKRQTILDDENKVLEVGKAAEEVSGV